MVAKGVTAAVAPYLPFLVPVAKKAGGKVEEVIVGLGAQAAWSMAKDVWARVTKFFNDDDEVKAAATMVASKPDDDARRNSLIDVLVERLTANPQLAEELLKVLGGENGVQQIIGDAGAEYERVIQAMGGAGKQEIRGGKKFTDVGQYQGGAAPAPVQSTIAARSAPCPGSGGEI